MSIKRIVDREKNSKITKLNDYIAQYNHMELKPGAKLLLQKIDAMRTQIYSDPESRNQGDFMKCYLTDPIRTEIAHQQLGQDRNLIFIEDSKSQIKKLTRSNWEKMTKPIIGKRSENYCKMDNLIHDVETVSQSLKTKPSPQALLNMKDALQTLQHQTLFLINNDIHHNKLNMKRNFEALLNTTNHLLKELDFNLPVFNTPEGKEIKVLIETMLDPKPDNRPSLNIIMGIAHDLRVQHGLVSEMNEELKQNNFKNEHANELTTSPVISPPTNNAEYSNKGISAQEFSKQFKNEYRSIIPRTKEPFDELLEEETAQTLVR